MSWEYLGVKSLDVLIYLRSFWPTCDFSKGIGLAKLTTKYGYNLTRRSEPLSMSLGAGLFYYLPKF